MIEGQEPWCIPRSACKNRRESVNEKDKDSTFPYVFPVGLGGRALPRGAFAFERMGPAQGPDGKCRPATLPATLEIGEGLAPTPTLH
jgi:hypothetical protein